MTSEFELVHWNILLVIMQWRDIKPECVVSEVESREFGDYQILMDVVRIWWFCYVVSSQPPLGSSEIWIELFLKNVHASVLRRKYNDNTSISRSQTVLLLIEALKEYFPSVMIRFIHYEDLSNSVRFYYSLSWIDTASHRYFVSLSIWEFRGNFDFSSGFNSSSKTSWTYIAVEGEESLHLPSLFLSYSNGNSVRGH